MPRPPSGSQAQRYAHRLVFLGVALFLLGLLAGFRIPAMADPRMGLTSHLEGVMNGLFLITLGLIWPRISLPARLSQFTYWTALYGTFANYTALLIAAITGAGAMMPIAGGVEGTALEEAVISSLLITLSLAMVAVCVLVLAGPYRGHRAW